MNRVTVGAIPISHPISGSWQSGLLHLITNQETGNGPQVRLLHPLPEEVMMTIEDIREQVRIHQPEWPAPSDPDFWSKMSLMIDREIDHYRPALKSWWLVWRLPFWHPHCRQIEVNYLMAVQDYYRQASPEKQALLRQGITEPILGHTKETMDIALIDFGDGITTAAWPLKNAHHIMKVEQHFKRDITSYDHIIEIGAGLGDMPRYCYDIGYTGTYTILDLAPTAKIQQAYLQNKYPVQWVLSAEEITIQPNTLVIATWSLSEIDYDLRTQICLRLVGCDWFVVFQSEVFGLINTEWFPKVFARATKTEVTFERMTFHDYQGGSFIAYGKTAEVNPLTSTS